MDQPDVASFKKWHQPVEFDPYPVLYDLGSVGIGTSSPTTTIESDACGVSDSHRFMVNEEDIAQFVKWFSTSYTSKTIDMCITDTNDGTVDAWVRKMCNGEIKELSYTTFDPYGNEVATCTFEGITIYMHDLTRDYDDAAPASHSLLMGYESMSRTLNS